MYFSVVRTLSRRSLLPSSKCSTSRDSSKHDAATRTNLSREFGDDSLPVPMSSHQISETLLANPDTVGEPVAPGPVVLEQEMNGQGEVLRLCVLFLHRAAYKNSNS